MFSTWDLVRPRHWYPMSALEQFIMESDHMADHMFAPIHPSFSPFGHDLALMTAPSSLLRDRVEVGFPFHGVEDDDFFRDLPVAMRPQPPQEQQHKIQQPDKSSPSNTPPERERQASELADSTQAAPASTNDVDQVNNSRGFSSYSFSSSSVLDNKGQRVTSTRCRYEDSTGRLKALHEREVDGKKLRKTWSRQHKDDEGVHKSVCSGGSAEEFEQMWTSTPFGEAQIKTQALESKPEQTKTLKVPTSEQIGTDEEMQEGKP
jgi:hypothetical protein